MIIILIGCCKEEQKKESNQIPFLGTWERSFSMGEATANITYTITEENINYGVKGPMDMSYTIKKDTFIANDNKWIGTSEGDQYVIFTKNITNKEITLLKLKAKNKQEALQMPFPSDSTRSKFSSWNSYQKK